MGGGANFDKAIPFLGAQNIIAATPFEQVEMRIVLYYIKSPSCSEESGLLIAFLMLSSDTSALGRFRMLYGTI